MAERCPIRGTSLYLVLKSNGLHHSKNLPVKFGFSPKTVPADIAKKLPSQRCSKSLFIAFSAFLTNGPRSLSQVKVGTHSAFGERSHTAAYTPKQGPSGWGRYYYPRSVPHVSETLRGQGVERQTLPLLDLGREVLSKNTESLRDSDALMRVAVPRRRGPAGLRCPVAAAHSARFSGIERLDQAFRQSYYHTQRPHGQPFGACAETALGGKMRAITLDFKESHHGRT